MSNSHFILIDSVTRQPVPLPFYTYRPESGRISVHNYQGPNEDFPTGRILCKLEHFDSMIWMFPRQASVAIITEEEFMRRQAAQLIGYAQSAGGLGND